MQSNKEPSHAPFRRTHYLINPRFQLKYALIFFGVGLAVAASLGLVAFFEFKGTFQTFLNASFHQPAELIRMLEGRLRHLTWLMAGLLLGLAFFCLALGILITHRVVGPVYKMRKIMDEITAGDSSQRLHFRHGDEFQEVAESFNRMLDRLQGPK